MYSYRTIEQAIREAAPNPALVPFGVDIDRYEWTKWRQEFHLFGKAARLAEQGRCEPVPALPFALFRKFGEQGERRSYEGPYFERRERIRRRLLGAAWLAPSSNGGFAFAVKGGHNGERHNHNDVGSFIIHAAGDSLLDDIGAPEYTKHSFGPARYSILHNRSDGHSVPSIDGQGQQEGPERRAIVLRAENVSSDQQASSGTAHFAADIASAYEIDGLVSLVRECRWTVDGEHRSAGCCSRIIIRRPRQWTWQKRSSAGMNQS